MAKTLKELMNILPHVGKVDWIGVRPARKAPLAVLDEVEAVVDYGLVGDRRAMKKNNSQRQVTLIQAEHLPVIAMLLQREAIDPELLRRNIVVSSINLLALREKRFQIGDAVLEGSGHCHPCSRMEVVLGAGGYNAMRGHGGITAKIIASGKIHPGDPVKLLISEPDGVM